MTNNIIPLILTIDDEAIIRDSIKSYLEDFDYRVITAENGRIGLEKFDQDHPDLVLVDLRMHKVDGLEVLAYVQKKSPETPILVVSDTGVLNDAVEALRLGAWDYLLKPIEDMTVLRHTIENALKRVQLRQENEVYQQNLKALVSAYTAELKKTTAALQASETLYRTLVETSPDIIFMQTLDGKISFINKAIENILGYTPDDIYVTESIFNLVHPDDHNYVITQFGNVIQGKAFHNLEHRVRTQAGNYIYVSVTGTPIRDISDKITAILVFMCDITARKEAEAEKEKLQSQLFQSQKMEALGRLTSGVAHDFNNLLTAINGYAELTMAQLNTDSQSFEMVTNILKSGKRAAKLVKQLLAFSRKQVVAPQIIDINAAVSKLEDIFVRIIDETVNIKTQFRSNPSLIKIDPTQFEQIVMNLIVNAKDAMPNGGTLHIKTSNTKLDSQHSLPIDLAPGQYCVLQIKDTGIGIPAEIQSHIFEPFFTTKKTGEGTGLGLSTVYGIVKQNVGDILIESHKGEGTCFSIYFPAILNTENKHIIRARKNTHRRR